MDLNALLQLLSTHMGGGGANNPFASLMKLLSGSGLGGPVNALNSGGGTGNAFSAAMGGQTSAPPSIKDIFGHMFGNAGGANDPTSSMPSMGHPQSDFPTNALGAPQQSPFNPRLQYFSNGIGGGAGGIYPSQGYGNG